MKISIFRKENGYLYIVLNFHGKKTLIATGQKSELPLVKSGGVGMGVTLDRKEPNGRLKAKRLEDFYRKVEEYVIAHPDARPDAVKRAVASPARVTGQLVSAMDEYADSGKVGDSSAAIIRRTARKVEEFDASAGFSVDEEWLDKFSLWLTEHGTKTNGVGLHLRNIRTVFNWARRKKMTKEYPFLDYQIKVERQTIRHMSIGQLREFRDHACEPWQEEYRDLFMLMVYLGGINVGDLLTCKGLVNGRLEYSRHKTGKALSVYVCDEAMAIIERWKGERWLLSASDRYKDYHGYMHRWNDGLKKIGVTRIVKDKVGKMRKKEVTPIFEGLSTYVARYTWATIAAECGVTREIIAACLGHSWSDVTSHYVAYSQKQMDDAIRKVAAYINEDKGE